jgi:hypothetical protein
MQSPIGLSTIALLAALGFAAPAQAQLLNLGDSGSGVSVNVGGSGGASVTVGGESAVSVDLGSGSTDTGGAGTDPGGASSGNILDIDGDGDDDDALIDLDLGGDDEQPVSLGGGGGGDGLLDVDGVTGDDILLDLFGDGSADADGEAVVNLDLGDDGDLLDLGGDGDDLLDIDNLLDGGVTGDDILLDLFGPGDGILGEGGVTADLSGERTDPDDVTLDVDDDTAVIVDLFGTSDELLDTGLGGDGAPEVTGGAGGTAAAVDILGDDAAILDELGADGDDEVSADAGDVDAGVDILDLEDADETGGGGDDDNTGGGNDDGGDDNGNGNGNGNGGDDTADDDTLGINPGAITGDDDDDLIAPRPAVRVAAVGDASARCFTPNEEQIAFLLQNRNYDLSMTASWASGEVDLVPVRLCPEARARLAAAIEADAEVQWLQDWVWADARIHGELADAGLGADNVLALDTKDGDVNIYVF